MAINDIQVSENFKLKEFECKDGSHQVIVDSVLVQKNQQFRNVVKVPYTFNSAYRNWDHNKRVGGSKTSQHMLGKAVDIPKLKGFTIEEMALIGSKLGFGGVGLYNTFVHFDVRGNGLTVWDERSVSIKEKQVIENHLKKVWKIGEDWGL